MRVLFICLLTFSFLFVSACDPAKPVSISNTQIDPNRMPRTNLPMPPSKPIEQLGWENFKTKEKTLLGDMNGKVVVLDFWATYCPPCIKGIPHLKQMQAKYKDEGFQVIGLHVGGEEDAPKVPAFIERFKVDYPIATPERGLTSVLLGNDSRIPQTLIFDRKGKLVKQFVSFDEEIAKQIDEVVEQVITDK